jgi:hypothetical protein
MVSYSEQMEYTFQEQKLEKKLSSPCLSLLQYVGYHMHETVQLQPPPSSPIGN